MSENMDYELAMKLRPHVVILGAGAFEEITYHLQPLLDNEKITKECLIILI